MAAHPSSQRHRDDPCAGEFRKRAVNAQDSLMASWPDHLSPGNQKRLWRDPVKRAGQS
jgi:hypothetical protein